MSVAPPTDAALIALALTGDQDAFATLHACHHAFIYNTLLRRTRSKEDAEDLTQLTFLSAYRALASFKGTAKFSSWLYRIALNHFFMKARHKLPYFEVPLDAPVNDDNAHLTIADTLSYRDVALEFTCDRAFLTQCLTYLPTGQRQIFLMHVEGYTHVEMAARLKCSVGTTKSQLSRAKTKLCCMMKTGRLTRSAKIKKPPATSGLVSGGFRQAPSQDCLSYTTQRLNAQASPSSSTPSQPAGEPIEVWLRKWQVHRIINLAPLEEKFEFRPVKEYPL